MVHFVLLSFESPGHAGVDDLRSRAAEALRSRCGLATPEAERSTTDAGGLDLVLTARPGVFGQLPMEFACPDGTPQRAANSAPSIVLDRHSDDSLAVTTDGFGLGHVYVAECGRGCVAVSTSSRVLADLQARSDSGATVDVQALGGLARTGHLLGGRSVFTGVRKLDASETLHLRAGRAEFVVRGEPRYGMDAPASERFATIDDAVGAGATTVRQCVEQSLLENPDGSATGLELSGGFDSRLLLAAVPKGRRASLRAFTLGAPDAADWRVATLLARDAGMEHEFVDLRGLDALTPDEAYALVQRAARGREFGSNPLSAGVLTWVNDQYPGFVRLSGQNGENARGFYYPAESDAPQWSDSDVRRLARNRIFANDSVRLSALGEGFAPSAADDVVCEQLAPSFAGSSWLDATDRYYVFGREQRWIGAGMSQEMHRRAFRMPFFSPDFHAWCRRVPPAWRRDGAALARVLERLDPRLARRPLDSGMAVVDLFSQSPFARLRRLRKFASKAGAKVLQKLRKSSRPPIGAASLAALVTRSEGFRDAVQVCTRLGMLHDSAEVAGVPTIGFVVNIATLAEDHGVGSLR
jgi:asparagine synthase (glutamine-hydrolysing)